MMWLELTVFAFLAVICNTAFPVPFDPVLIYFASRHTPATAVAFAIVGSVCAALAGVGENKVLGILNRRIPPQWTQALLPNWRGRRFYILAFVFALLPLPFSLVRLAILRHHPRLIVFGFAIAAGRLPRYVLTVTLWRGLCLPDWVSAGVLLVTMAFAALKSMLRCRRNGSRALESHRADLSCRT